MRRKFLAPKCAAEDIPGNFVTERASDILAGEGAPGGVQRPAVTIAFEDAVLVDRCRNGEMQAFSALVAKYQHRVYNLILRMCHRPADAEELAQETFLKALESIAHFRGHSQFYTWLFRIATNLAISRRRRDGRVRFQSLTEPDEFKDGQADRLTAAMAQQREASPDKASENADAARRIAAALQELDDEFRAVVVLRDVEDMDYSQIAEVLDLPPGTVKSRLHRARCLLKEKLVDLM